MASVEFIQKRIAGKEKEIEKLQKKLERIQKAADSNWENNPYWYSERDLTITEKEIASAKEALKKYQDQLDAENQKAQSRNIPAILDFLEQWKVRTMKAYNDAFEQYVEALHEWYAFDHEYIDWYNREGHRTFKENPTEFKRRDQEHRDARAKFQKQWNFITPYIDSRGGGYFFDERKFQKDLDQEANAKYDFIVERTNAIVEVITDATNLKVGAKGDLNGFIIGTKGTAKVQTVGAGGPVQCFHFRTLIKRVSG